MSDTPNADTRPDLVTVPTTPGARPGGALGAYALGDVIGRGGMGEVVLAHDVRLDRDVAIKRMRGAAPSDDAVARFLREAKIQARLDHPAVVPVHELGTDEDGQPYFAMKRLTGVTLAKRLASPMLRDEPRRARTHPGAEPLANPVQHLLRAFVDVCLAVARAHTCDIIHRDLKPANIMLGDFGEVYVLDWGLARILDAPDLPEVSSASGGDRATQTGDLLGTPGYMAPEQIRDAASVERPADIYALGAILFEILAGEPAHPRGDAIASTLDAGVLSPARRAGANRIPPELDALCTVMLSARPELRPTAREAAARTQAYLDGDRDLELRHTMAERELSRARGALADGDRAVAIRAAGRALALDPDARSAAELVSRLIIEPPSVAPPGLTRAWREADAAVTRSHANASFFGFLGVIAFVPVGVWNGVRSWFVVIGILAVSGGLALATRVMRNQAENARLLFAYYLGVVMLLFLVGLLCGPLILAPALACLMTWAALMFPALTPRPVFVVGMCVSAWLAPVFLQAIGALGPIWKVEGGVVVSSSVVLDIGGVPSVVFLFGGTLLTMLIAGFHASALARANLEARKHLVAQRWHLEQLLETG